MPRTGSSCAAREHNLKNLDVEMPRDLIVITGLSKAARAASPSTPSMPRTTPLRRVADAYARQFLGQMEKPDVDQIDGLSPAISIDQKGSSKNPRSTVGTVTEVYDYLRLLFARIGRMHCPICGREITRQTVEQIIDQLYELPDGTRLMLLAPLVRDRKGEHEKLLAGAKQGGFVRVRVDGELVTSTRRSTSTRVQTFDRGLSSTWSWRTTTGTTRLTPPAWRTRSRPRCGSRAGALVIFRRRRRATASSASGMPARSGAALGRAPEAQLAARACPPAGLGEPARDRSDLVLPNWRPCRWPRARSALAPDGGRLVVLDHPRGVADTSASAPIRPSASLRWARQILLLAMAASGWP
jgi:hypothetical protein